jgi:hypothetical protein
MHFGGLPWLIGLFILSAVAVSESDESILLSTLTFLEQEHCSAVYPLYVEFLQFPLKSGLS